jgi:hypothetical protein
MKYFFIFFTFFSLSLSAQSIIIDPDNQEETLIKYLDGKSFNVPEYGIISFELNRKQLKEFKEKRKVNNEDGEDVELEFSVDIKRDTEKKKDRQDYSGMVRFYARNDDQNTSLSSPNASKYMYRIFIARHLIYPIKNFPSHFTLLADGELYFDKYNWKKMTFIEYKNEFLKPSTIKDISGNSDFIGTSQVKCNLINKQKK